MAVVFRVFSWNCFQKTSHTLSIDDVNQLGSGYETITRIVAVLLRCTQELLRDIGADGFSWSFDVN